MAIDNNLVVNMIKSFYEKPVNVQYIKDFTQSCYDELNLAVHFDDDFNDYICDDKTPCFTEQQADLLNEIVEKMFEFCSQNNLDIHEIAESVQKNEWDKRGFNTPIQESELNMSGDLTSFQYHESANKSNKFYIEEDNGWLKLTGKNKIWYEDPVSFKKLLEYKIYSKINENEQPIQNNKFRTDKEVKTQRNRINQTKAQMKKDHQTVDNAIGAQKVWQVDAKINESDNNSNILDLEGDKLKLAISKLSRESIINWLENNDPHGEYDDDTMMQENGKPLLWKEAAAIMFNQISRSNGSNI